MNEYKGVQKEILESIKKNQLVSAGAGSGKTTIMVEKIANLILENKVQVENLLVVTFTVLAANEMKERLIARLKQSLENQTKEQQEATIKNIEKLETASIDTIDGFSSKTIKKYFYALDISPNIQILSEATGDYYLTKSMEKTIDDFMLNFEDANILLDLYGGNKRNFDRIKDILKTLYFEIINIENYEEFLESVIKEYEDSHKSEMVLIEKIKQLVQNFKTEIIENYSLLTEFSKEKISSTILNIDEILVADSFNIAITKFLDLKIPSREKKKDLKDEVYGELVDAFDYIKKFQEKLKNNKIDANYIENNKKIIKYAEILINLLKKFIDNYKNIKEKNNLIDFNDLNRLLLKLLKNDEIKTELNNQYNYIFVDEFQDVNPLQEKLINEIAGKDSKCFYVGDVKQSIYGFRGATPEAFLTKYEKYKKETANNISFDMNCNYRSSENVLNFVNEIFTKIMNKKNADIDYANDCKIEPKNGEIKGGLPRVYLINDDKEKFLAKGIYSVKNAKSEDVVDSKTKEAYCVLKIITDNVGKKFYDAKQKCEREYTYSDIAILSRSDKDESAKVLIDILRANNVPLGLNNKLDVLNSESIKVVLSILKCVAGVGDDVDYLASFMALTNLSVDDIVSLRDNSKAFYENLIDNKSVDEIAVGFKKLESIKKKSYVATNKELILYILENEKLKYYFLQKENGAKEIELINEFIDKFSSVEDGLNLNEFIEVVESSVNKAGDFEEKDNENSVTIQTIHKSKGLEYPIVILFNAGKEFAYVTDNDTVNFNLDLGLGFDYFNKTDRSKSASLTKLAITLKNAEKGYKEEMRLLYVALTRAKNQLYITGTIKFEDINKNDFSKTSFLKMILSCYAGRIEKDENEFSNCIIEKFDEINKSALKKKEQRQFEILGEDFEYANNNKFSVPIKNTVTGINSKHAEDFGFKTKEWLTRLAQFGQDENEANITNKNIVGTHYHKVLEQLDLQKEFDVTKIYDDVDYQLIKKAYNNLKTFTVGAKKIYKEAEFMMYVPYNQIVESKIEDKVLIQGVCDLLIEYEDSITIVDYKFSNLSGKLLKEKYSEQLKLYQIAAQNAFNKPVKKLLIYSIKTGELI